MTRKQFDSVGYRNQDNIYVPHTDLFPKLPFFTDQLHEKIEN